MSSALITFVALVLWIFVSIAFIQEIFAKKTVMLPIVGLVMTTMILVKGFTMPDDKQFTALIIQVVASMIFLDVIDRRSGKNSQ